MEPTPHKKSLNIAWTSLNKLEQVAISQLEIEQFILCWGTHPHGNPEGVEATSWIIEAIIDAINMRGHGFIDGKFMASSSSQFPRKIAEIIKHNET